MFYKCLSFCPQGGGGITECIAPGIPSCLGAGLQGGSPGPCPRGKLRGIWSRPTAKGKLKGIFLGGACSRGCACSGDGGVCSGGGACSRGWCEDVSALGGMWRPPHDIYCCRRYASYWNAFLFLTYFYRAGGHRRHCTPPDPLLHFGLVAY